MDRTGSRAHAIGLQNQNHKAPDTQPRARTNGLPLQHGEGTALRAPRKGGGLAPGTCGGVALENEPAVCLGGGALGWWVGEWMG